MDELRRDVEKHKTDKQLFHEKYKKLQDEMDAKVSELEDSLAQKQEELNSLKMKQKEKLFKGSYGSSISDTGRSSEQTNGHGLKELNQTIEDLKQKFEMTTEQLATFEQNQ